MSVQSLTFVASHHDASDDDLMCMVGQYELSSHARSDGKGVSEIRISGQDSNISSDMDLGLGETHANDASSVEGLK
jgi:hypothetical protein